MADLQERKLSALPELTEVSPADWTFVVPDGGVSYRTRVERLAGGMISVSPEQFGGKGDGATDNYQPIVSALAFLDARSAVDGVGGILRFGVGSYYCSAPIDIKSRVTIEGSNAAGTSGVTNSEIVFPADTVGIYLNRKSTLGGVNISPETTAAEGSLLRNIMLRGQGGTTRSKHGIVALSRFIADNVNVHGFAGNGVEINSTGLTGLNVNYWRMYNGRISGCQHGIHARGGDVNGGSAIGVEVNANRGFGIKDDSFLGVDWGNCGSDGNGILSWCSYGGSIYYVLDETLAGTTQPGTNAAVWALYSSGSPSALYREWTPGNTLEWVRGGSAALLNDNSVSTLWGGYLGEPNQPPNVVLHKNASVRGYRACGVIGNGMVWTQDGFRNLNTASAGTVLAIGAGSSYDGLGLRNEASLSSIRRTRIASYLGFKADGITNRPLAALVGSVPSNNASDRTTAGIGFYDPAVDAWADAITFEGQSKTAAPGEDNTWSFGGAAKRWLKGWFGTVNINALPTYADNAAATTGGLVAGDLYRTSTGAVMVRY